LTLSEGPIFRAVNQDSRAIFNFPESHPEESHLYRRALGHAWDRVLPAVRRAHRPTHGRPATGEFAISWGANPVARGIATLMRLPRPSVATPVELNIEARDGEEVWTRKMGGTPVISHLRLHGESDINECVGAIVFQTRMSVTPSNGLQHRTVGIGLQLGRFVLPLPMFLGRNTRGSEEDTDRPNQVYVKVAVWLQLVGKLIEYEGYLNTSGD
jgi:hypothetical protein